MHSNRGECELADEVSHCDLHLEHAKAVAKAGARANTKGDVCAGAGNLSIVHEHL
jgi:hypothetical protein